MISEALDDRIHCLALIGSIASRYNLSYGILVMSQEYWVYCRDDAHVHIDSSLVPIVSAVNTALGANNRERRPWIDASRHFATRPQRANVEATLRALFVKNGIDESFIDKTFPLETTDDFFHIVVLIKYLASLYTFAAFSFDHNFRIDARVRPADEIQEILAVVYATFIRLANISMGLVNPRNYLENVRQKLEAKTTLRLLFMKYGIDLSLIDKTFPKAA